MVVTQSNDIYIYIEMHQIRSKRIQCAFDQVHGKHFYQWIFREPVFNSTVSGLPFFFSFSQCFGRPMKMALHYRLGGAAGKTVDSFVFIFFFHWQQRFCPKWWRFSLFWLSLHILCILFLFFVFSTEILVVCRAQFHDVGGWFLIFLFAAALSIYCIFVKIEMSQSGRSGTHRANERWIKRTNGRNGMKDRSTDQPANKSDYVLYQIR